MYLWLYFNFLTSKPIQLVQITYLWLNEDISAQNHLLCKFFLWNGQKNLWCKSCLFFGAFSLILLISIWCKPSFEIKFDQFGQVTMLFWCEGGSHPPCTWQGFQTSHLLGLNEKNSTAKIWQIFLTKFFTKIGFFELLFFYIFVNISSFRQHIWACSTSFFAYKCQGFTEFEPVLINQKLNL